MAIRRDHAEVGQRLLDLGDEGERGHVDQRGGDRLLKGGVARQ
ncbi:MAG: hypothetical protein R2853_19920 [Thermomicrobiales bacterium]